jgi:hypothetical protein
MKEGLFEGEEGVSLFLFMKSSQRRKETGLEENTSSQWNQGYISSKAYEHYLSDRCSRAFAELGLVLMMDSTRRILNSFLNCT